jgi:hypothetical protein
MQKLHKPIFKQDMIYSDFICHSVGYDFQHNNWILTICIPSPTAWLCSEFMARTESKLPSGRFSIFTEAVIRRLLFPIVHWCDACLYETLNLFHWSISSALTIVYKLHFHIFTLSTFHTFCIRLCSWVCFSFVFQDDRSLWNKAAILIWSIFTTEKQATRWARRLFLVQFAVCFVATLVSLILIRLLLGNVRETLTSLRCWKRKLLGLLLVFFKSNHFQLTSSVCLAHGQCVCHVAEK